VLRFVETLVFTRLIEELLSDEEQRRLQLALLIKPDAGKLIRGSGGVRKMRWALEERGKSGGARILYYLDLPDTFYMLFLYAKKEQENLTADQLKTLRKVVENLK
jgi:hypothetical protein